MNRFSSVRKNALVIEKNGSASFRSSRTESRRAAARATPRMSRMALPASTSSSNVGDEVGSLRIVFGSILFALPVAAGVGLVLLLIAAGVLCSLPNPDSLLTPLGLSALGVTVLCGGFVSSSRAGRAPLLCGLLFGGLAVLTLFAGSLFFSDVSREALSLNLTSGTRAGLYVAMIGVSCLGAVIGKKR